MRNANSRKMLFVILAVAALMALFVLAGCGGHDDNMKETMMPAPMGYKVTVTNNLSEEFFAPIVVTHAHNDHLLFDGGNYVTEAAEHQILTGEPDMVLEAIGEGAVAGHGMEPTPDGHNVLLGPGQSVSITFEGDATALRVLAMVAPTEVPDNYVSAVVDVLMEGSVTVPLSRFDIGHDEMTMDISRVDGDMTVGTVTITRQ